MAIEPTIAAFHVETPLQHAVAGLNNTHITEVVGPEKSMDLTNDPRFFTPNIIEKRLFAFNGPVALIAGLLTTTALGHLFSLRKDFNFGLCEQGVPPDVILRSVVQCCAFTVMSCILFMSLFSTLVCVYQAYFTYRLMTAGTNGFELAKRFYLHPEMTMKRHRAVSHLGWGLVLLLVASGGMLYVKFANEGNPWKPKPSERHMLDTWWCRRPLIHPLGLLAFIFFFLGSVYLRYSIQVPHKRLFDILYSQRSADNGCEALETGTQPFLDGFRTKSMRREVGVSLPQKFSDSIDRSCPLM